MSRVSVHIRSGIRLVLLSGVLGVLSACGGSGDTANTPPPPVSATEEEVGKLLFEDTRLSANNNQSCASCHTASAGFADPGVSRASPVSEGSFSGQFGNRNAPSAAYAGFAPAFGLINDPDRGFIYAGGQFLDGRRNTLEDQAKDPFLNAVEMANPDKASVVNKVSTASYADKFKVLYGSDIFGNVDLAYDRIAQAIAAFERSAELNRFNSKFDCYLLDSTSYPLTAQEQTGLDLFNNKAKCASCHSTTADPTSGKVLFTNFQYFNIGVPSNPNNPANIANAAFVDLGLGGRLSLAAENGKFKTPTLRNIELTAPYMHNGVFDTLEEVMAFYNIEEKALASPQPEVLDNITPDVEFLGLIEPTETDAIVAFMKTLTDGTGVGLCI